MLRINAVNSAGAAVKYFHVLARADHAYHVEPSEPQGVWGGRGADMLGLSGFATIEAYAALAGNLHPTTNEPLTPRTKLERRSMYDFTFSVPKAVSLLHAFVDPETVRSVFDEAVASTMRVIEADAATRVRMNKQNHDRVTGNLVWATYVHRTSRPVDGAPDPHLHAHVCVFNQTFDPVEKRWKAVQLGDVKHHAPLYEAIFLAEVANGLEARGYQVEGNGRSWRVAGIPSELESRFSRRTQIIERTAEALGINDPERKAELGKRTRERKGPAVPYAELCEQWRSQLTPAETAELKEMKQKAQTVRAAASGLHKEDPVAPYPGEEADRDIQETGQTQRAHERERARRSTAAERAPSDTAPRVHVEPQEQPDGAQREHREDGPGAATRDALPELDKATRRRVDDVIAALLEREGVVSESKLIREAVLRHPGKVKREQVAARLLERDDLIRREHRGVRQVTSRTALEEEQLLVQLARDGRGRHEPLSYTRWEPQNPHLNPAQRAAVRHVLASGDRVTLVHGGAEEGKLDFIREVARAAEERGHTVRVFAPTADAARGQLRASGLSRTETVTKLLSDTEHEARVRGTIWVVDSAEQLGNQQMTALLALAKERGTRVVLVGDVRRGRPFARGEALRVISEYAGLQPAGLSEIFHQRGRYRDAAEALSLGLAGQAVQHLSVAGALRVRSNLFRAAEVAEQFVGALKRGRTALAIATTSKERQAVTAEIRTRLAEEGVLGKARRFEILRPAGLDERDRTNAARYEPGMVVQFGRGVRGVPKLGWNGFRAGERVTVVGRDPFGHVLVLGGGQLRTLPLRHADRFEVYRKDQIDIAKGDTIRITRSGYLGGGWVRPKWDRNPLIDQLNVRRARKRTAERLVETGALLRVRGFTVRGDIKLDDGRTIPREFAHVEHGYCLSPHAARTRTAQEVFVSMPSWALGDNAREQLRTALGRARDRVAVFTDDREVFTEQLTRSRDVPTATRVAEEGRAVAGDDPRAVLERVRLHREVNNEFHRYERRRQREQERKREREREREREV